MAPEISEAQIEEIKKLVNSSNRTLVLGIGEVNMGDDGFGPYVGVELHKMNIDREQVKFMNGKTNYHDRKDEILEFGPDLILVVDTCASGDPPGTFIIADESKMVDWVPISSHVIPIQVYIEMLRQDLPEMKTFLLGVNPLSMQGTIQRKPYMPENYTLDDYDADPELPFYEINLTTEIKKIADDLIAIFRNIYT